MKLIMSTVIGLTFILSIFSIILYNNSSIDKIEYNDYTFINSGYGVWKVSLIKGSSVSFIHSPLEIKNFFENKSINENFAKAIWDKSQPNIAFTQQALSIDYNQEFINYLVMMGYNPNIGCYKENCSLTTILNTSNVDYVFDIGSNKSTYENLNTGYLFNSTNYNEYVFFMEKIMLDFLE